MREMWGRGYERSKIMEARGEDRQKENERRDERSCERERLGARERKRLSYGMG